MPSVRVRTSQDQSGPVGLDPSSTSDEGRQEVLTEECSGCSRTCSCRSWCLFHLVCSGRNTRLVRRRRLEEEKKKTSTEGNPPAESPFSLDVSDKTARFFSPYGRLGPRVRCGCRRLKSSPAGPVTWPEHPPAVLLVRGALAVVAVSLRLVVAGLAVHLEAVVGTLLRGSGAVFGQVALACCRPANASRLLELWVETQTL